MNVNCTPIKPQVAFGSEQEENPQKVIILGEPKDNFSTNNEASEAATTQVTVVSPDEFEKTIAITDRLNNEVVRKGNIKTPFGAIASVLLAGCIAFVSGKKVASIAETVVEKVVQKSLPNAFETTLKKASGVIQDFSKKLITKDAVSKLDKLKVISGRVIKEGEQLARTAYKKVAYSGITKDILDPNRSSKAFQNIIGSAAVVGILPGICKKDNNENGVSDLLERTTNAYDGTQKKCKQAIQKAGVVADIISELT